MWKLAFYLFTQYASDGKWLNIKKNKNGLLYNIEYTLQKNCAAPKQI